VGNRWRGCRRFGDRVCRRLIWDFILKPVANTLRKDQKAIEEERNVLIQAFNHQAQAQAHLTQQVAKMVTATDDMKLAIVSRMDGYTALPMPVVDEPQKLLG